MTQLNYPKVGLGVLIFDERQRVLLGQRCNSHGANSWAPPGGHLEFGESFAACAIRETMEETSLNISSPQFVGITNDVFVEQCKHYVSIFMLASKPLHQAVINCEPHKTLAWHWFAWDDLPTNLFLPLQNFILRYPNFTPKQIQQSNTLSPSDCV